MNRTEDVFLSHEHLWSYRTRTVDPNSLTIRSVTHNGILQHSTAETLCEEAARISTKELVELKNANHCPFTFNEYLSYYFYKIYLAYNCSENAIIKNRWIIRNIIDPNITTDPLLHNVDAKYLKDLINACKAYCEGTEYAVAKLLQLFSDDIWKHGEFQSFWRHALDYNKSYHSLIKKYIIPVLGDKRINDVTTDELIKILKETEIPDTQNFPMEKYSMLYDAVSSFFRNAPTLYLPMLLSATAGLQIAEIVRIHFDDIDLDNHCLDLPRTHKDYNGPRSNIVLSRENTKTVYLPDIIMNEIKNQEKRLKALQEQDAKFNPFRYLIWSQNGKQQQENFIKKPYERILSKCSFPAFPWRSFLKIRLTDKEIDELEDSLGYETPMNSGACEIPIDKHDLMDLTGTTYF